MNAFLGINKLLKLTEEEMKDFSRPIRENKINE